MGRWGRSKELAKASWGVLREDKELLVLPLVSGVAAIAIGATFLLPILATSKVTDTAGETQLQPSIVSYVLNRRHTYRSDRPHDQAGWRFAVVAGVGFVLTLGLMTLFVDRWALPYFPAQIVTTGIVLLWSFFAHKFWTFGAP